MMPTPPTPHRRLADRLLDEGVLVAQSYAEQDRLDPTRPPLSVLVAEAIAAAERRGEQTAADARDTALAALLDLIAAVDRWVGDDEHDPTGQVRAAAARARRHLRAAVAEAGQQ